LCCFPGGIDKHLISEVYGRQGFFYEAQPGYEQRDRFPRPVSPGCISGIRIFSGRTGRCGEFSTFVFKIVGNAFPHVVLDDYYNPKIHHAIWQTLNARYEQSLKEQPGEKKTGTNLNLASTLFGLRYGEYYKHRQDF